MREKVIGNQKSQTLSDPHEITSPHCVSLSSHATLQDNRGQTTVLKVVACILDLPFIQRMKTQGEDKEYFKLWSMSEILDYFTIMSWSELPKSINGLTNIWRNHRLSIVHRSRIR